MTGPSSSWSITAVPPAAGTLENEEGSGRLRGVTAGDRGAPMSGGLPRPASSRIGSALAPSVPAGTSDSARTAHGKASPSTPEGGLPCQRGIPSGSACPGAPRIGSACGDAGASALLSVAAQSGSPVLSAPLGGSIDNVRPVPTGPSSRDSAPIWRNAYAAAAFGTTAAV